ncbi:MAG: hypothetical protein CBC24_00300 [Candidatus Pelagibacter sp. TMED64]|nr:hypothetical protein [Candidatus Pelagibacter sp.]OUU67912.1 MAG: hypothetical protein CBC24_00300 [Candidatus Pelagibacter sp. TMED64]|tara:strand:+ start:1635 stop:2516 length:882 start_codon:yes stop_codon:yes gene_type:complete
MKIVTKLFLIIFLTASIQHHSYAEGNLKKDLNKISQYVHELIPGDGITEFDFKSKESREPSFSILAVRDIAKSERSNFFTQFSLQNNDVGSDERYIANLGFGYRGLSQDESTMIGLNGFYDRELTEDHERLGIGMELRGSLFEFNINKYFRLSKAKNVSGTEEQALGGTDYNARGPLPHMPWAKFSWTGYNHEKDEAASHTRGNIYAVEMALTPYLQFDFGRDIGHGFDGPTNVANLTYKYPPNNNITTLVDGLWDSNIFEDQSSMKGHLSDKVKRNNVITVEIQGAVIITSQ